ncbi:hypothetical protein [Nocardiopsis halophila]|uniref:hypothetical protein n=1 Tax=Nocardiopsis halophila TaxID=141692 RepID=UPI000345235A|nr:hypothetical protein [Nocardiopsis halophila]
MPNRMSVSQWVGVDRPTRISSAWSPKALKRRARSALRRTRRKAARSWRSVTGTGTVATARRRKGGGATVREHTRNGRVVRAHTRNT